MSVVMQSVVWLSGSVSVDCMGEIASLIDFLRSYVHYVYMLNIYICICSAQLSLHEKAP